MDKQLIGCWLDGGLPRTPRRRVVDLLGGLGFALSLEREFPYADWRKNLDEFDREFVFEDPNYWVNIENDLIDEIERYLPNGLALFAGLGDVVVLPDSELE